MQPVQAEPHRRRLNLEQADHHRDFLFGIRRRSAPFIPFTVQEALIVYVMVAM